jgi:hypothetical protein
MLCNVEQRSDNELKRQFTCTAWDYVDAVSTISRMENLLEMMHGKKRRLYESMDEQLGMMRPDDQPPEQKRGRQPKEPPTAEQLQRGKKRSMIDDNDMPPVTMTPRNTRQLAGVPHSGMLSTMHGQESTFDSCVESEYSTAWRSHRQWHAHNEAMCRNSLVTLRRNVDSIRHSYTSCECGCADPANMVRLVPGDEAAEFTTRCTCKGCGVIQCSVRLHPVYVRFMGTLCEGCLQF